MTRSTGNAVTGHVRGMKCGKSVDVHVGARIRFRRNLLGLTQEQLAETLDLTYQQVQKYEKGVNRISASRLLEIARILQCPISFFFLDLGTVTGADQTGSDGLSIENFLGARDSIALNNAFMRISRHRTRQAVVDFVRSIADRQS